MHLQNSWHKCNWAFFSRQIFLKNHIERRLEAKRIVCHCIQIRVIRVNMHKILALLKKKSEVCLSLATKCKIIDEKLCSL